MQFGGNLAVNSVKNVLRGRTLKTPLFLVEVSQKTHDQKVIDARMEKTT